MTGSLARCRLALDILTEGKLTCYPRKLRNPELEVSLARFNRRHQDWLSDKDIEGYAVNNKLVKGLPTGELALQIYVRRKRKRPSEKKAIPKTVTVPALGVFKTDVVEVGTFELHSFTGRIRPVRPGCSIGLTNGVSGTLGCWVKETAEEANALLRGLTCAHVLTDGFKLGIGLEIFQPIGQVSGRIGSSLRIHPLVYSDDIRNFSNEIDAGLFGLNNSITYSLAPLDNSSPPIEIGTVRRGTTVHLLGAQSGAVKGRITNPQMKKSFFYPDPNRPGTEHRAGFKNLVECDYEAANGDSGGLVRTDQGKVIGIHIGSWSGRSLFCRFRIIARELRVSL